MSKNKIDLEIFLGLLLVLPILFIGVFGFVTAQSSAKTFYIDDTFKVGWTEGTENYEASYKVWRIEETAEGNAATLLLMPIGGIGISNKKEGDTHALGVNARIHFQQVYVSGNDKWISITLENAEFKEESTASTPPGSGGSGGGSSSGSSGGAGSGGSGGGGGSGGSGTTSSPSGGGGSGGSGTVPSSSGGGGGSWSSQCEKYYECPDGSKVQYCFIHKLYNENGEIVGVGCGCKSDPLSLCTMPSGGGGGGSGGGQPIPVPTAGSGGGSAGRNETPIICNGCIIDNKCAPIGYRHEGKYCKITSEFVSQLNANAPCDNNFECSTNLCIDNKCVSSSLWQKFVRLLNKLFG